MLGDTDAVLGSVPQNASIIQGQKDTQQRQSLEEVQTAQAPANEEARAKAQAQGSAAGNQVTISPQIAKGLEKMTGQKWDQAVGTKWNANVFTAIVTGMTQAKYHQDVQSGKIVVEGMKEAGAEKKTEVTEAGKDARQGKSIEAKHEDVATQVAGRKDVATTAKPKAATPKDPAEEGKSLLESIGKAVKAGDDTGKQTAIANYNTFAKEHGLASYTPEEGSFQQFAEKVMNGLGKLKAKFDQSGKSSAKKRIKVKGPNGETGTVEEGDKLPDGWSANGQ
jgi:hypothetical protein